MDTLYLDPDSWDLDIDASRNIAIASAPYATAQTVANASRLWRGEAPYNTNRGIPYETDVLGQLPPQRQLSGWYETEAETVPGVEAATAILQYDQTARAVTGQIQCTLTDGTVINV